MSIFANMPNDEKREVGQMMLAGLRREIYRLALSEGLDPETFVPADYPDPETLEIDPTQYFRVNFSDKVSLYQACQKYVNLEEKLNTLS